MSIRSRLGWDECGHPHVLGMLHWSLSAVAIWPVHYSSPFFEHVISRRSVFRDVTYGPMYVVGRGHISLPNLRPIACLARASSTDGGCFTAFCGMAHSLSFHPWVIILFGVVMSSTFLGSFRMGRCRPAVFGMCCAHGEQSSAPCAGWWMTKSTTVRGGWCWYKVVGQRCPCSMIGMVRLDRTVGWISVRWSTDRCWSVILSHQIVPVMLCWCMVFTSQSVHHTVGMAYVPLW